VNERRLKRGDKSKLEIEEAAAGEGGIREGNAAHDFS
jgi:hypothetical protein